MPVVQTNSIGINLALIPPGEFDMGSPKGLIEEELRVERDGGYGSGRHPKEDPQHRVRITKPYWLGVTEVTQEEYQQLMGNNPGNIRGDPRRPVVAISWDDAVEFCRRLSELPRERTAKRQYGLPTEAQWEYACRAGNPGRWSFSDQLKNRSRALEEITLNEYAWFGPNAGDQAHPVGEKRANVWGLYDMYGNAFEWCRDWYDPAYYAQSPTDDPAGPSTGSNRVARGGCFRNTAGFCRSAFRDYNSPSFRGGIGFRVCLVLADN